MPDPSLFASQDSPLTRALALVRAGGKILEDFVGDPPDEVFHYTNTDGLIGILEGRSLWATDLRCMNDTDELSRGEALLSKALDARTAHPAHGLLARLRDHPAYASALVFGASFSSKLDVLSQWRAYADDGNGFAVASFREDWSSCTSGSAPRRGFTWYP